METRTFDSLHTYHRLDWDFDHHILTSFINLIRVDAATQPDPQIAELCRNLLNCTVVMDGHRPVFQNFDPSSEGSDCWYNFMRSLTFLSYQPVPDIRGLLQEQGDGAFANLYGNVTPQGRAWEDTFDLYYHIVRGGADLGKDDRLSSKKRYNIRQQPRLNYLPGNGFNPFYATGAVMQYTPQEQVIDQYLPAIIKGWSEGHARSYGIRNGFTQLCLWRWLQANLREGHARLYQRFTDDGKDFALAGFTFCPGIGWVYQTFWQPLPITQPLATAMLAHCLPTLPNEDMVWLTCPSVTGDERDSHYETYKRKFATGSVTSYSEFLGPFDDAKPPFYNTLLQETVK